jgi:Exo-beta-D-glucosaminidase Ig-fold domain/Glycosyl hydrolases family 2/Glycosyl hydrolases family 2, sugar binding domain
MNKMIRLITLAGLLLLSAITATAQEKIGLSGWKLRPADSTAGSWIDAVVPGAVFTSYVQAGLEKDPNYADNIYKVDQRKYNRDFWYKVEFASPTVAPGRHCHLHFDGINRKGEIFLNGTRLGLLDGFMERGDFDITGLLAVDGRNVLTVLVSWPGRPIANHASPTYISSDGWDWMPSVPGLLQGIVSDVYLVVTGGVTIKDPWIRTDLPSRDKAVLSIGVDLSAAVRDSGVLSCVIQPGNIVLTRRVHMQPGENAHFSFDTAIGHPRLWWPNGYGDPNLYTCTFRYTNDSLRVNFGIRKYSYDTAGGVLHIKVNGERIFVKGGNWGMSEYLLRCRGAEYDWKVLLHREMHLNMIRNWIGSTTDEEFYDACDKYGIMVWDDFWLNSHPNLPDDIFVFNKNAVEKIKRFRNHPSIAVWCGDNESYPLPPLNNWLREDVRTFDGGDRLYQANSHSDGLTGSGPWCNFSPTWYFTKYPGGFGGTPGYGFRTEIGTAVFTTYESFRKFMPDSMAWPQNAMWDKHFFGKSAANAGPDRFVDAVNKNYGTATGIEDFCRKAQLVNIETNKALYEGWQHHIWDDASGVMTWMSQSAYPSFVWQTYDYYYDLTGAYWGVKKACEPVHIQWSYADNSVKVVNTTLSPLDGLRAEAIVYQLDGKPAARYGKVATIDAAPDTATGCFEIPFDKEGQTSGLSAVHFIRLSLKDRNGRLLSDNFYWRGNKVADYTALNSLPPARLKYNSVLVHGDGKDTIRVTVSNPSSPVAFAIRVQAVRASDGERLLPALMDDNYFTLFKGEHKTVDITFDAALLNGGAYKIFVEPYNK